MSKDFLNERAVFNTVLDYVRATFYPLTPVTQELFLSHGSISLEMEQVKVGENYQKSLPKKIPRRETEQQCT